MKAPVVSVILPAYNCAHCIEKALDSALYQDVEKEILVIDDGSKDDLNSVMERYQQHSEIRYCKNDFNMGAAKTRNRGVSLARGSYVAFLDSDDIWEEGKLRKQVHLLEETQGVLCATARELMTPEGELTGKVIPVPDVIEYKDLLRHNPINCSSVLIRKNVAEEFPMHHEESHEDYIMWLEILGKYKKAYGINEPLLKYRLTGQGKSGSKWKSAKMTFMVYRNMGFSLPKSIMCFLSYVFHGIRKYFI